MEITISFGVSASTSGEAFDYDQVFAAADAALYEAKRDRPQPGLTVAPARRRQGRLPDRTPAPARLRLAAKGAAGSSFASSRRFSNARPIEQHEHHRDDRQPDQVEHGHVQLEDVEVEAEVQGKRGVERDQDGPDLGRAEVP